MTSIAAQTALKDFDADLQRVDQLLGLILDFRSFAATVDYEQKVAHWEEASKLMTRAHNVRTDLPVLAGSLLMYVCGRFENFVRELVGTIIDDLIDHCDKYEDLPVALRKEHLNRTLAINQNPSRYNFSTTAAIALAADLAVNLASMGDKPDSLRLDSAVITITESNMNSETIADLYRRVGINQLWDTLGKQASLQAYLVKSRDADCTRAAKEKIDEIMSLRNRIAHPIKDMAFPDVDSVEDASQFFRVLARVLVDFAPVAVLRSSSDS